MSGNLSNALRTLNTTDSKNYAKETWKVQRWNISSTTSIMIIIFAFLVTLSFLINEY